MNRLRDETGEGPIAEKGIELLRRTPATPNMPEMKRRVWSSLERPRLHAAASSRFSGVRTFAIAGVVVCLAGSAGAMLTRRWILPTLHHGLRSEGPTRSRAEHARLIAHPTVVQADMPIAPENEALTAEPTAPKTAAAPNARSRASHRPAPADSMPSVPTTAEHTAVFDAMIALRRDHDPDRAGRLLAQYLESHPRGPLREEALVLATEAAAARNDADAARAFARSYLDAYPKGRFRGFALDHVGAVP